MTPVGTVNKRTTGDHNNEAAAEALPGLAVHLDRFCYQELRALPLQETR